ncbi:MAG TPA: adenylate/guanylate cyclase domain-containing protein [Bacteroidota bacterium]|nr:adenylate/guanylate cyclase domain-containing protein [Bacteroidota bacterium]
MYLKNTSLSISPAETAIYGERENAVIVYADLRGFAHWSLGATPGQITRVIQVVYDRVIQLSFFYRHTFHKFLGDGFLLIWEAKDHLSLAEALRWALSASFEIHKKYWYIARQLNFPSPLGFGIGISCGEVIRIDPQTFIPELNEPDFVGYPMNSGSRLQKLAGPYGTVLDQRGVREAMMNPERVLRAENPVLRLELIRPHNKSISMADRFTGLHEDDVFGFQYVTWPYVKDALWKIDGRL